MKKTILLMAGFMLLASVAWSDELELGIGAAAIPGASSGNQSGDQSGSQSGDSQGGDVQYVLRAAYTTFGIINISFDSVILSPSVISNMTGSFTFDPVTGASSTVAGIYRPGMVNLFDVGIKFALFNKLVMGVQVGGNSLYIYHMNDQKDKDLFKGIQTDLGANIKVSTGWKFGDALGVELAMYSIQPSVTTAITVLKGLVDKNTSVQDAAVQQLTQNAAFAGLVVLYL